MEKKSATHSLSRIASLTLAFVMAAALALSAAGCGGSNNNNNNQSGGAGSSSEAASSDSSGSSESTESATTDASSSEETKSEETTVETAEAPVPAGGPADLVNLDGPIPIVKDGEKVKLSVVVTVPDGTTNDPVDRWWWQFMDEYLNIEPDVEAIFGSAFAERKTLLFAAGDLADLLLFGLSTSEIMRYGVNEGRLLDYTPYIDTYMPNMKQQIAARPVAKEITTTPDGKMYSIPSLFTEPEVTSMERIYINDAWLKLLGLETPKTIDEFMDVMRAFKGSESTLGVSKVIPLGGGFRERSPMGVILQSLGYVYRGVSWGGEASSSGMSLSMRNGEPVFPCFDDAFIEYLKYAKAAYDEGLLSPSFFTMDITQINAEIAENSYGFFNNPLHANTQESSITRQFVALTPLTSAWNNTPQSVIEVTTGLSSFFVNADTKYPEVCARFADLFYSEYCALTWPGPVDGTEMALGWPGMVYEDGIWTFKEGESSLWQMAMDYWHTTFWTTGDVSLRSDISRNQLVGITDDVPTYFDIEYWNPEVADSGWMNWTVVSNILPYRVEGYPATIYMTDDQATKLADLGTVISPYAVEQVARFISGERPLDDFDAFRSELSSMGMDEYLQIYVDLYKAYKGS